jgi:hypothetical protein
VTRLERCRACGQWLECSSCGHQPHDGQCQTLTGDATGDYDRCSCRTETAARGRVRPWLFQVGASIALGLIFAGMALLVAEAALALGRVLEAIQ